MLGVKIKIKATKQCQLSCQTLLEDLINDEYDYKLYMSKVQARMPLYVCFWKHRTNSYIVEYNHKSMSYLSVTLVLFAGNICISC